MKAGGHQDPEQGHLLLPVTPCSSRQKHVCRQAPSGSHRCSCFLLLLLYITGVFTLVLLNPAEVSHLPHY